MPLTRQHLERRTPDASNPVGESDKTVRFGILRERRTSLFQKGYALGYGAVIEQEQFSVGWDEENG